MSRHLAWYESNWWNGCWAFMGACAAAFCFATHDELFGWISAFGAVLNALVVTLRWWLPSP